MKFISRRSRRMPITMAVLLLAAGAGLLLIAHPLAGQTNTTLRLSAHTYLVQAAWLHGIGCPTNAITAVPNSTFTGVAGTGSYTDSACMTGDANDQHNEGL